MNDKARVSYSYAAVSERLAIADVRIVYIETLNKELLDLLLVRDADIRRLEAELTKSQRVTAIDQSFNGPDAEPIKWCVECEKKAFIDTSCNTCFPVNTREAIIKSISAHLPITPEQRNK